ncbi:YqgE/AlgH family protein [Ectothiorhodospira shaposhnikovii]|uniref:YqgE/AlgH family protein n=1 Tax=Ectothiorhodospira shaposhnikovii TaxID=1054 RepID=UPI001EE87164|nr:YqgE/AlgH family protein [Ectothiorhodospira shaposhnikovii]MCG5512284.1 YqgE/AlgH family protein [Ectothiorhodospira shaposhnikovii]
MRSANFTDQFLIAMPTLADPNFHHAVTYLCEHTDEGAMGIVINHPTDLTLEMVLDHMGISPKVPTDRIPVYNGGPVQPDRGFILHPADRLWTSTMQVSEHIAVTTSRDILEAMAEGSGPDAYLIALGYAGWGPGQLEQEIGDNAWLTCQADADILFRQPAEKRWQAAAGQLGVDLSLMSGQAGHA